tara:strand:+ start:375 stop:731 length:357 start_codon:yes stop_codon:yes gene_type:complete
MEEETEEVLKKVIVHVSNGEEVSFNSELSGMGLEFYYTECPLNENDSEILSSWIDESVMTESFFTDRSGCSGEFKFKTWREDGKWTLDLICNLSFEDEETGEISEELEEISDVLGIID